MHHFIIIDFSIIAEAAILSPNANGNIITDQDIILAIKNWLRHASARLNNSQ